MAVVFIFLLLGFNTSNIWCAATTETWDYARIEEDVKINNLLKNVSLKITPKEKADSLLKLFPVIDGHNDFAWQLRNNVQNQLHKVYFNSDLTRIEPWASSKESFTDIPRLHKGHVGAQFWVAYTQCDSQMKDSVLQTLEQIDVILRLIQAYPQHLEFCKTSECIIKTSYKSPSDKIASLIGIEGGHSIESSAGALRQFYELGVRYMGLTHSCSTPWADASPIDDPSMRLHPVNKGLSGWGLRLIDEMNRIGMMVDLSHASEATMIAALERSAAPVIFSHSGAKAICNAHRNVPDNVLRMLKKNNGIIMVYFYSKFVYCTKGAPRNATILDVVRHIEHIRFIAGINHIGIGGDYDGVDNFPKGLEDVSKYPDLFVELLKRGFTLDELRKISFLNIIRVMEDVEKVSKRLENNYRNYQNFAFDDVVSDKDLKAKNFSTDGMSEKSLARLVKLFGPVHERHV